MTDQVEEVLAKLPRLGEEVLGECMSCGKLMLETGTIVFYRVTVQQCGIDPKEIGRHAGLAMSMGGGAEGLALASVLGPGVKPAVEIAKGTANVCLQCLSAHPTIAMMDLESSGE